MPETASSALAPWSNFYTMIGSSAAALTGLMFVVITLVRGSERVQSGSSDGISTFSTPTVVHFGAALLVAAMLIAPWRLLISPAVLLGLVGLRGMAYVSHVFRRTKTLTIYTLDLEDRIWFTVLPLVAYGAIFAGAIALVAIPVKALFAIAAGATLLIFVGIHNAWDVVTFLAMDNLNEPPNAPQER